MNFLEIVGLISLVVWGLIIAMIIYYWAKYKRFIAKRLFEMLKMMKYLKSIQGGDYGITN
jgi:hypothetical protein